jgi:hypothetical protein
MKYLRRFALLVVFFAAQSHLVAAPSAAPTTEDIQKEFNARDYSGVLRDIAHALSRNGKAAQQYDHYDLLMMRGETHLRLKQASAAALSFKQAVSKTTDADKAAMATAMQLLVLRSPQLQYTPKKVVVGKKNGPYDIIDPEKRKQAITALYEDELNAAADAIKTGKKATSLPQIAGAVKAIEAHNLIALDRAAHGNTDDVKTATEDLKARTRDLISRAMEKLAKETLEISGRADEMQRIPSGRIGQPDSTHRRGLQGSDMQDLNGIVRACKQISDASKQLMGILSDNPDDANDLIEQADGVRQKAEKALRER